MPVPENENILPIPHEGKVSQKLSIALFDFDRTLVSCDSFRLFGHVMAENLWQRTWLLGQALAYKAGRLTNAEYKARVIQRVWAPRGEGVQQERMEAFHAALRRRRRAAVVHMLYDHLEKGHAVIILSASPRFYLAPFVHAVWSGSIEVYGSEMHVEERGRVTVDALYGEKKRTLVRQLVRQLRPDEVWAYTDHRSDLPLLEEADHRRLVAPSRALRRAVQQRGLSYQVIETLA